MRLVDRTILITGGSSGIGLALAAKFLELGNKVIITGRSSDKLAEAKKAHPALHTLVCDAADPSALIALGERIDADFPDVDVLLNNAGTFVFRSLEHKPDDLASFTNEINVNFIGAVQTVAVLVERLRKNKGAIINVSSGLAFVPLPAAPIYCATKAALHSYTLSLRTQLAGQVEVIELMPPAVKTQLTAEIPEDGDFKLISTDELVTSTMAGLRGGAEEIRPGQANQLHWMSRIAPNFINAQIAKGSAQFIPN